MGNTFFVPSLLCVLFLYSVVCRKSLWNAASRFVKRDIITSMNSSKIQPCTTYTEREREQQQQKKTEKNNL